MAYFLTISVHYKHVELGIFKDTQLLGYAQELNPTISKKFFTTLDSLLKDAYLTLDKLDFIAASQGPAPFTTLRSCLASVNGLAFAKNIPLVGLNSLEVFLLYSRTKQSTSSNKVTTNLIDCTVGLFNAFCNEVYYGILDNHNNKLIVGSAHIDKLLAMLKNSSYKTIEFMGSGTELYKETIINTLKSQAYISEDMLLSPDIKDMAHHALILWEKEYGKKKYNYKLLPFYLKSECPASFIC